MASEKDKEIVAVAGLTFPVDRSSYTLKCVLADGSHFDVRVAAAAADLVIESLRTAAFQASVLDPLRGPQQGEPVAVSAIVVAHVAVSRTLANEQRARVVRFVEPGGRPHHFMMTPDQAAKIAADFGAPSSGESGGRLS